MARIQQTFVSGSLWIGTGSNAASLFDAYVGGADSTPFAIYSSSNPLLYFNTNESPSLVIPITTSINSPLYSSGFLGQGFKISAVPKTIDNVTRYFWTGEFDDLWVRGSMHVKQMVIDQIRATNGSLWITDAGKASSASFVQTVDANAGTMSLYFDTTSTVPFTTSDIIRSKRWIPQGNTIQHQWDFVGGVTSILYNQVENNQTWSVVKITGSKTGTAFSNYYLDGNASDWKSFVDTISVLQSQWVRVGNLTGKAGRTASIYLTSNDAGGPFMDMVSGVSTIAQALGGSTASGAGNTVSVTESRIKMRTGNLQGIYDSYLGGALSGYGLWADNVYLRGKIVANDGGTLSNWTIGANDLSSGNVHLHSETNNTFLGFNTTTWGTPSSIYIGSGSRGVRFGLSGSTDNYLWFSNSILTIKTPNFAVDGGSVSMSGTVSANAGSIGGWTIDGDNISSNGITLTPGDEPFIGIGTVTYGDKGIWLGEHGEAYKASFYKDSDSYLDWDGSKLTIKAANFQLNQNGVISASGATFSGKVTAESGEIGGWTISEHKLSGQNESGGQVSLATSGSYWNIIDEYGNANRSSEKWDGLVDTITNIYNNTSSQATFTNSGGFWQYTGSYVNDPNWQGPYFSMSITSLHPESFADSNITFTKSTGNQFWKVAVFKTRLNLIRKPDGSVQKVLPSQQAEM